MRIKWQLINYLYHFLGLSSVFLLTYCQSPIYYPQLPHDPESVIITGKILNYQEGISKDSVVFYPNDVLSGDNNPQNIAVMPSGTFKIKFSTAFPCDPFISYYSQLPLYIHPGDSIHIELDARDTFLFPTGQINYSGDRAEENEALIAYFLKLSPEFSREKAMAKYAKIETLKLKEYIQFVDSIHQEIEKLSDNFLTENHPPAEITDWIKVEEASNYHSDIRSYLFSKQVMLDQEKYFDIMEKHFDLPLIEKKDLSNASYSRILINWHLEKNRPNQNRWKGKLGDFLFSMDSITLANILKNPVNLTQQIVLSTFGHNLLEAGKMSFFEKHLPIFKGALKEPLLLEALEKKYADIQDGIYIPSSQREQKKSALQLVDGQLKVNTGRSLPTDIKDLVHGSILDTVLHNTDAKIIYVDIWSIECGASLVHLPSMEKFRQQYSAEALEVVTLCLDSEEWHWRNQINKHDLQSQNYHLTSGQSQSIRDLLRTGAPFYLIIDARGVLHKEGVELWPDNPEVKATIDSLLEVVEVLH